MAELESLGTVEPLQAHLQRHALDRLVMLSDGVFAISVTLAALEIHLPEVAASLGELTRAISASLTVYLISFLAAGMFWLRHRDLFARLQRVDRVLTGLTLALLALVALVPVAVSGIGHHGNTAAHFAFYALVMIGCGLLNTAAWVYAACNPRLMRSEVSKKERWLRGVDALMLPVLFAPALVVSVDNLPRVMLAMGVLWALIRRVLMPRLARTGIDGESAAKVVE